MRMVGVRFHLLSGIERDVELMLGILEQIEERELCDDLSEFRERLFERMADAQQEGAA